MSGQLSLGCLAALASGIPPQGPIGARAGEFSPLAGVEVRPDWKAVAVEVAARRGINPVDLLRHGPHRIRALSHARFEVFWDIYCLKRLNGARWWGLSAIGRMFGCDHSTVLHGLRRHAAMNGLTLELDA